MKLDRVEENFLLVMSVTRPLFSVSCDINETDCFEGPEGYLCQKDRHRGAMMRIFGLLTRTNVPNEDQHHQ